MPRAYGEVRPAADRECCRYRRRDEGVTSALAGGAITPGEAATMAPVVDTFVRAIGTSGFERRLQLVEAGRSNHPGLYGARPGGYFNRRRDFAADSLQVQQCPIAHPIFD